MAEGGVGTDPQVFVVDSQANLVSIPRTKKPRLVSQKSLLLLVGLALLGLVVEGFFIYKLYKQNENLSTPTTSSQQGGTIMGQVGPEGPTVRSLPQQIHKPFAHLIGPNTVGKENIVQWVREGDAITYNMSYDNGRLSVKKEGYYYLYSKVQLNAAEECSLIQHKVMKDTKAYGLPIELMKSKSIRCRNNGKGPFQEDLWQSFLAGIFHLENGDQIFVTLDNIQKMRPGPTENFMGAFMVYP